MSFKFNRKNKGNESSFKKGHVPWNKGLIGYNLGHPSYGNGLSFLGKKHTKKSKEKMRLAKLNKQGNTTGKHWKAKNTTKMGIKGELHWNWKGGKTPKLRLLKNSISWKKWRKLIFERDNYTCQDCGKRGIIIHLHHLKSFVKFEELRFEIINGITLCKSYHYRRHTKNV